MSLKKLRLKTLGSLADEEAITNEQIEKKIKELRGKDTKKKKLRSKSKKSKTK